MKNRNRKNFLGLLVLAIFALGASVALIVIKYQTVYQDHAARATLPTIWYTVSGKQILEDGVTPFVPYGVQLGGITMAVSNWQTNKSSYITQDMISAAQSVWHANTVSLQLASANLFDVAPYDSNYLSRVDQIVNWATSNNMNIILVLQYEGTNNQVLPTQDSVNFWNFMSQRYANRSRIIFDVFNEPHMPGGANDDATAWNLWKNGGTYNGVVYVGMQQLVNTIRANAQNNLIFVSGLAAGEDIKLLPSYTLSGTNIVYAIHPYFNTTQHANQTQWDNWFGTAASTGNFPIVADEWNEYQNGNDPECYPAAAATVPTFLSYLKQKNIGLVGYSLYPGTLIRGWNFSTPTAFDEPTYTCPVVTPPNMDPSAQGAGQLLMDYFQTNAKPL